MVSTQRWKGALILGAPRSGTTLLRRLLDAHSHFACPAETNVFVGAAKFLRSDPGALEVDVGVIPGLSYAGFDEIEVLARFRNFVFQFLDQYASRKHKAVWIEKTAFNAFYIREIERICEDQVRYVCVIRHGLDVACSIRELSDVNGGYLAELHEYIKRYPVPIEAFSRLWVHVTEQLLDLSERRRDQTLLLKYEDLVRSPEVVLRRVCRHLSAEWEPSMIGRALRDRSVGLGDWKTYAKKEITSESIDRWKKLSRPALDLVVGIVNPTLSRCGYETIELTKPIDKDHRHALSLMLQHLKRETEVSKEE